MKRKAEFHKIEITSPAGETLVAHGSVLVSMDRALIDVTNNGIFGGPADFAKRFAPGQTTLRIEMLVAGEIVRTIPPTKRASKRSRR